MNKPNTFLESLEFYINPKMEKDTVYIGKHQLRFKTKLINDFNLSDGDRLMIGFLKDEPAHVYLIKSTDERGQLLTVRNNSYMIAFKGIINKLGLMEPQNCRYEIGERDGIKYVKVILPKFGPEKP